MRRFERMPIRTAWLFFVLPSLAINYFGQGTFVLAHPERLTTRFFLLYPDWVLLAIA